jgi:nucleotide-binding universal stress UspA family protein
MFAALRTLDAPIFLVFFVVAGAGVHLDELAVVGLPGVVYVVARMAGKVGGGWIGAELTRPGRRARWGPWVGAGLSPFAGMAIGLAAFTLEKATQAGLDGLGQSVSAIVLGSVVVFELIGPVAVGKALDRTGESGADAAVGATGDAEQGGPRLIRHILVPLSSPGMARRKASQIVDLAASTGATLSGLHVVTRDRMPDDLDEVPPALRFVELVAQARDVEFKPVVRVADSVVDAIVDAAEESDVDLVVLGEPYPRAMDRGGGQRIVHEVARRVGPRVRVLVVPTLDRVDAAVPAPEGEGQAPTTDQHRTDGHHTSEDTRSDASPPSARPAPERARRGPA